MRKSERVKRTAQDSHPTERWRSLGVEDVSGGRSGKIEGFQGLAYGKETFEVVDCLFHALLTLRHGGRFANRPYSARMIQHIIACPQRATWRRHGGREEVWPGESHSRQEQWQVSLLISKADCLPQGRSEA